MGREVHRWDPRPREVRELHKKAKEFMQRLKRGEVTDQEIEEMTRLLGRVYARIQEREKRLEYLKRKFRQKTKGG